MRTARGRGNERGSEIVEFSLTILPFFAILFLIVDASWVIFVRATLQFAVREGVRYAITGQTGPQGQDAAITSVVQNNAMGLLNGPAGASLVTINYYQPGTAAALPDVVNSNIGGNVVQVSVNGMSLIPMAPLWRSASPVLVFATSGDIVEPSPGGVPPTR